MFVGRKSELLQMNKMYRSDQFECLILYGRRRVGKTFLINEFVKDKRTIYFTGTEGSAEENLAALSQSIYLWDHESGEGPVYQNYESALNAVGDRCAQEPTVFVLDEYPYLAKAYPAMSSVLQQKIDLLYQNIPGAMLIICGSSMSFMEHQVLGYQSPLYGRRTAQIRLQPFSFFEIQPFFESYAAEDLAVMYGVTGGIPKYLSVMNASISVQENIRDQFFSTSGYLYEEPENLLKQELREPAVYNSIIRAVAQGCSKNTDLTSSLGFSSSKLAPYLSRLLELGILKKETPVLSPEGRKSTYSVNDGLFRFWYLTVPRQNMLIQRGYSEQAFANILPSLETFMGGVFEEICKDYLWQKYDSLPVQFERAGRWWGANPHKKQTEEIDIVAANEEEAIFCECKWRNKEVAEDVLEKLVERSLLVPVKKRYYILFAKKSFSDRCRAVAAEKGIRLIEFREMHEAELSVC